MPCYLTPAELGIKDLHNEVIKDLQSIGTIAVSWLSQCAGHLMNSSQDKAEALSFEEMSRRVKIALRALQGEEVSTSGAATTTEKTSLQIGQDMVPSNAFDPLKLSDKRLRQFVLKLVDTPGIFKDGTDPEEILRVEAERFIANERRDMRLSVSAPLTTDREKNPLYHCAALGETKEVILLLPTKDSESRVLRGTIRFKRDKFKEFNQQSADELLKEESSSKLGHFWFEVEMKMTKGFSILGATLYEKTNKRSIEDFKRDSPIPKSVAKGIVFFGCESDPSNPSIFELNCYTSWDHLTNLSNVLVFHVKEDAK